MATHTAITNLSDLHVTATSSPATEGDYVTIRLTDKAGNSMSFTDTYESVFHLFGGAVWPAVFRAAGTVDWSHPDADPDMDMVSGCVTASPPEGQ